MSYSLYPTPTLVPPPTIPTPKSPNLRSPPPFPPPNIPLPPLPNSPNLRSPPPNLITPPIPPIPPIPPDLPDLEALSDIPEEEEDWESSQTLTMQPQLASKRASTRFSTYSMAPSLAATVKTSLTSESAHQEIYNIEEGLEKLENKKLANQRFVPSKEKTDTLGKLALGAKLERALDRRLDSQDAVMRKKSTSISEKSRKEFSEKQ